jgi:hypothetical protein
VRLDITESELGPLHRALAACKIPTDRIPDVAAQLIKPPLPFALSASAPGAAVAQHSFDGDTAALMLRLNEGRPGTNAQWKDLTRAERQRAKRLWKWVDKPHGLNVSPQGRPTAIDAALVLYCVRVLSEATNQSKFTFARSFSGNNKPYGPMWTALLEALPLARSFLTLRYPEYGTTRRAEIDLHTESIAEIVTLTNSKTFGDLCRNIPLGPGSVDVAASPAAFRVAIADARHLRMQTHAKRRQKRQPEA